MRIDVNIEESQRTRVEALLDTGAEISLVARILARRLKTTAHGSEAGRARTVDGSIPRCDGTTRAKMEICDRNGERRIKEHDFVAADILGEVVTLGYD